MEDKDEPTPNVQHLTAKPVMDHERIIAPTEASIKDVAAAQAETVQTHLAKQPAATTASSNRAVPLTHSVYPEATRGFGIHKAMPTKPVPSTEHSAVDAKISLKIVLVRCMAGCVILLDFFNLYHLFQYRPNTVYHWVDLGLIAVSIVFMIGIFRLNEAARSTYVLLSLIMIVLTIIGFFSAYNSVHTAVLGYRQPTIPQMQRAINDSQKNNTISYSAKQRRITTFNKEISYLRESSFERDYKLYTSEFLLLLVAVGPLLFYTRPAIKSVFS